MLILMDDKI